MDNVRTDDPYTSREAFLAHKQNIGKTHLRIMRLLREAQTSTASEMMDHAGMIYNSTWRRLSELKKLGLIENSEDARKNPRGYKEVVFTITPEGAQYLRDSD